MVSAPLLIMFVLIDSFYYWREKPANKPVSNNSPFKVQGKINFILLLGVMLAVIISGTWDPSISFEVYHVPVKLQNLLRDVTLLALAYTSLKLTSLQVRSINLFSWSPIVEVAKIFAAIFITAMPVLDILDVGEQGALGALVKLVTCEGTPDNLMYFWMTGLLSAFLDNAPTYLVFFHMAGGNPQELMGPVSHTLAAISSGAVFMGALTYIGNAPNFIIKSIAEINNIPMPSFFGYLLWSSLLLLPLFGIMSWIRFG